MSFYYLEIKNGLHKGKMFALSDGAISVGRNSGNTIQLPNEKSVSGHHAIIYKSPERILLQDLQSTNGSFVNEENIQEKELVPGDIAGFGKSGPRAILIKSETQLSIQTPAQNISTIQTTIRTAESQTPMMSQDSTSKEDQNTIYKMKRQAVPISDSLNPSKTVEYEQKLMSKNIKSDDMKELLSDNKRFEKILNRGNLGTTQTNMLRSVNRAHNSMRKQWYFIIGATVLISLCVTAFFGIRAFQYKQVIAKAKDLKSDLDDYEQRIASAKNNPEKNKDELKRLIAELEEKQKTLSTIKAKIDVDDFGKFYSDPLEKRIDEVLQRFGESDYHIPQEMKDRVQHHIDVYSGRMKNTIKRYIQRREKYFPFIEYVFREKNLPIELAYISMLESGFNPMALSHAGARGLWQFMPHTGRRFGLAVNDEVDERTNPEKATYAAAEYFKELIGMFGGKSAVMLCMAAYNAGEGRIMGALRKIDDPMRNRDFWYIYRMGYLAEETNEYIPRVIAMIILSEHQEEYGLIDTIKSEPLDSIEQEKDFVEVDFKVE